MWLASGNSLAAPMIVVDGHQDVLLRLLDKSRGRTLDEVGWAGQANIANWRTGGLNAIFFAVWIDPRVFPGKHAIQRTHQMIDCLEEQERKFPHDLKICDTEAEVRDAIADGKIASLLGIEGGVAINDDLKRIEEYRARGVRYMTLTWRGNLRWAGSSQELSSPWQRVHPDAFIPRDQQSSGGLTAFGRQVVSEMNRVGMIVDLSHVSDKTFFDAIEATSKPVMVSHSCARALSRHDRNVSDDMLRALARNKGVIGLNFWYELLEPNGKGSNDEGATSVTAETIVDQVDHVVKVAGIKHVGIGSDFEGMSDLPTDVQTAAEVPRIFEAMRKRGYSEEDIVKFAGENFLRVMRENEVSIDAPVLE